MSTIHRTAVIDSRAQIGPDVTIGPFVTIEGPVTIGAGSTLHAFSRLIGPLTMGARNVIHAHAVVGDAPQDRKFKGEHSETILGDENFVREGVTIHRGTGDGGKTILGSRNFLLVNSHVGHNCVLGDDVMLVNGALLAGHVRVGSRAIVGGNCAIHQFCRIGQLAMISNNTGHNVDIPPFFTSMSTNHVTQLNMVGLKRANTPKDSIDALKKMFQLVYRTGRTMSAAIEELPKDLKRVPEVEEFITFVRSSKRGVARWEPWSTGRLRRVGLELDSSEPA